jgi:hypothetical protein
VLILSGGDITKRDAILWGYTVEEARPYVRFKRRDLLFREAVLYFLGCGDEGQDPNEEYCRACRNLGEDDCANCDPSTIRVLSDE